MSVRIVFGIMSAVARQSVVEQLVDSLGDHQIVIHHDFSQQPEFRINRSNVSFIAQPARTGWGTWGHTQGVFKLLEHVAANRRFDYFQLLSPSCLPIRPISEFERSLVDGEYDANNVYMDLSLNRQEFMNFAYRVFAPTGSLRFRALRRIRSWYFGNHIEVEDRANLQVRTGYRGMESGQPSPSARFSLAFSRMARQGWLGSHPFMADFKPFMGDVWFGARPPVVRYMLEKFRDPDLNRYFSKLILPDELLIPSILGNSPFRIGPASHLVNNYVESHPQWFDETDLARLAESSKYFARKFPNDPAAPVRRRVLERLSNPETVTTRSALLNQVEASSPTPWPAEAVALNS